MQEEGKNKKEKWGEPKLIILVRDKPEERALVACKSASPPNGARGALQVQYECYNTCTIKCAVTSST